MTVAYTIEWARPEHLSFLPEIEHKAALLFRDWNVPPSVIEENTPIEDFQEALDAGLLWVALSAQRLPVGFALVELEEDCDPHLEELDVHPEHGRRGIGTALVNAVCAWAEAHGYPVLTLTTYHDIPWNGPFYTKLGFTILDKSEWTPALRARVAEETARGLEPPCRVAMRKTLTPSE
ncbi:MAG: GNAT family N-acetyltransferase [Candidatus Binatia bacterium]